MLLISTLISKNHIYYLYVSTLNYYHIGFLMKLNKKPYKGTRDFFPKEKRVQDFIFNKMKQAGHLFGYESYDGPLLEEVELYKAKSGEELINDQIYSFKDRGERFVAIRPEMTPTVARMVSQIHREVSRPIRWYSIPNLMRYEKPQKGRLREHWQFNCDIFGAPGREGEVEILQVAITLLQNFGATSEHFEILINDRAIVDTIFTEVMELSQDQSYRLYKIVDKSKKISLEALKKMLNELDLGEKKNSLFLEYLENKTFNDILNFLDRHEKRDISKSFRSFSEQIEALELSEYIKYDPAIVRGLDYYTGIVFEIFDKHPDNRRAICGGGSYANLLKIFNEPALPGVGFGLGDVTLTDFLKTHELLPDLSLPKNDILLTFQDQLGKVKCLKLAQKLRVEEIRVITQLDPIKVKKVFPLAEKKGAKFVALMGSQELENESVQIKNMESKEQFNISINDIDKIKKTLRS